MNWVAPEPTAVDEPFVGSERALSDGFLEAQRYQFLRRCAGLDGAALTSKSVPPSELSLLGLMQHLTDVERHWVRNRYGGASLSMAYSDPFHHLDPTAAETVHQVLQQEWESSRVVMAQLDTETVYGHPQYGPMSTRWLYGHLIREYAGHIGHADLLRQAIDGRTFG
ncbi:MAG: DUF664 domain-containing protein [Microlunatus sp.]